MPTMPTPSNTKPETKSDPAPALRTLSARAIELAEELERGQAETPLGDQLAILSAGRDADPLTMTLLAPDESTRRSALDWLCGADWAESRLTTGLIAAQPAVSSPSTRLRLLYPESIEALIQHPRQLKTLCDESVLLVKVDSASQRPAEEEVARHLAADLAGVWTLSTEDLAKPPPPALLKDEGTLARRRLADWRRARNLETAAKLVEAGAVEAVHQCQSRIRSARARLSSPADSEQQARSLRDSAGALRRDVEKRIEGLERRLSETQQGRLTIGSVGSNKIKNFLEDLGDEEIETERDGRLLLLRLRGGAILSAQRLVVDQFREDATAGWAQVEGELEALGRSLASKLGESTGAAPEAVAFARIVRRPDANSIGETLRLPSDYGGEISMTGWFEALRQEISHAMMPLSLIGGLGTTLLVYVPDFRAKIKGILPLLFILGYIWARRNEQLRHEDLLSREAKRLRETLQRDMADLYARGTRAWTEQAIQHLRDVRGSIANELENHLKQQATALAESAARERGELQAKSRNTENRIRDLSSLAERCGRVVDEIGALRQELEQSAREAVRDVLLRPGGSW